MVKEDQDVGELTLVELTMALVMGYLHAYYTYTNNTGAKMSFLARKKGVQKLV